MNKYDGINKVESLPSVNTTIKITVKKPAKFKGFFINLGICSCIALCLFSCKFLPIPKTQEFSQTIKSAIEFDMIKYIKTKVKN